MTTPSITPEQLALARQALARAGGLAAAASMTPEQRRARASRAGKAPRKSRKATK